jgi:hypothetical protein
MQVQRTPRRRKTARELLDDYARASGARPRPCFACPKCGVITDRCERHDGQAAQPVTMRLVRYA